MYPFPGPLHEPPTTSPLLFTSKRVLHHLPTHSHLIPLVSSSLGQQTSTEPSASPPTEARQGSSLLYMSQGSWTSPFSLSEVSQTQKDMWYVLTDKCILDKKYRYPWYNPQTHRSLTRRKVQVLHTINPSTEHSQEYIMRSCLKYVLMYVCKLQHEVPKFLAILTTQKLTEMHRLWSG